MQINLKKLNKSQIKAIVELDQQDLQKYINKTEDMLGDEVEVKGFRRGKAPKDLAKKHIKQEEVRILALEMAIKQSLSDVIKDNSLDVLDTSQLSVEKNNADQLRYSVLLDLFPEIKLVDLSEVKIKRREVTVGAEDVEDALETIKNSKATLVTKNDSETAENGDRVEVDFEVKKDGRVIEGGVSKNHPLIIGGRGFMPGFEDQLVGMKKGESKLFSLTAPDDYFYRDIAGKKLDFSVKMVDIKKIIRPEIDDSFARSSGQFTDLSELKDNIKTGLIQEKNEKENRKLRLEILDRIINRSKIGVPDNLLNKQLDIMISDFDRTLHEKGLELGLYLARIGKTQEGLRKDWTKDAEKQVKITLILKKLTKDFKLEATQQEVEEAVNQVIQSAIARGEVNQTDIDLIKIRENIAASIVNEKALNYIESRCAV